MKLHRPLARALAATLALPALWFAAMPASAQSSWSACAPTEALTSLQKRVIAKSQQGPDELRRYIHLTAPIHQLSWHDTKVWLESRRAGAACVAHADGAGTVAASESTPGTASR